LYARKHRLSIGVRFSSLDVEAQMELDDQVEVEDPPVVQETTQKVLDIDLSTVRGTLIDLGVDRALKSVEENVDQALKSVEDNVKRRLKEWMF
jgi:hypothetical protein